MLPDEIAIEAFSDIDLTSIAIFSISSLLLRSPQCWHMNPLLSAFKREKYEMIWCYNNPKDIRKIDTFSVMEDVPES